MEIKNYEHGWQLFVLLLKHTAIQKGITYQQISAETGFNQPNISRVFSLRYKPTLDTFIRIAKGIGINFYFEDQDARSNLNIAFGEAMNELGTRGLSKEINQTINIKNLRIGNFLRSKVWRGYGVIEGIELTKTGFKIKMKGYIHEYEEGKYFDLEEIELTEEWLKSFGFIEESENMFFYRKHNPFIFRIYKEKKFDKYMCEIDHGFKIPVPTVSILQNIIFATSKQELVFKE